MSSVSWPRLLATRFVSWVTVRVGVSLRRGAKRRGRAERSDRKATPIFILHIFEFLSYSALLACTVLAAMAMTYFLEEETINVPTWIRNNTSVKLFSIGQPKAGDDHFQRYFYDTSNKMRKAGLLRIYRIINNQDPCVCFPPSSAGYEHVGVPICYELEVRRGARSEARGAKRRDEIGGEEF